ncbi:hypothetical protein ABKV19_003147 [Rosa sericea]
MNATPPNDFMEAVENHSGSDSDTNIDDDDAAEYYQPVSAVDSEDDEENHHLQNDAVVSHSQLLPNGVIVNQAQRGVSSLRLNDDVEGDNGSSSEQEEEEVEIVGGSDSAITRAIREDESRRHAPLTPENATRVMEAMRGISFVGVAPDWADRIPEENWIDRLRRLRQSPQS